MSRPNYGYYWVEVDEEDRILKFSNYKAYKEWEKQELSLGHQVKFIEWFNPMDISFPNAEEAPF